MKQLQIYTGNGFDKKTGLPHKNYGDGPEFVLFPKDWGIINMALSSQLELESGDKVHFLKGCIFPRVKLREYGKNHDITITRSYTKATKIVVPSQTLRLFVTGIKQNSGCFKNNFSSEPSLEFFGRLIQMDAGQLMYPYYTSGYYCHSYEGEFPFDSKNVKKIVPARIIRPTVGETDMFNALFDAIKTDPSVISKFITESSLHSSCGNDIIINDEVCENIINMLKSNDRSMQDIGVDLMAACNYKDNYVYLYFIFAKCQDYFAYIDKNSTILRKSLFNFFSNQSKHLVAASKHPNNVSLLNSMLEFMLHNELNVNINDQLKNFQYQGEFLFRKNELIYELTDTLLEKITRTKSKYFKISAQNIDSNIINITSRFEYSNMLHYLNEEIETNGIISDMEEVQHITHTSTSNI